MSVAVISACYGLYDAIKPAPEQDYEGDIDWILVTDEPDIEAPGWKVIVERRPHVHPNVAAKIPKLFPIEYTDADVSIWADASSLIKTGFVSRVVSKTLESEHGWAMFPHPNRTKITDEVTASRGLPKYDDMDLEGQVAHYVNAMGYPNGKSLWATGIIGRRSRSMEDDTMIVTIGNDWMREIVRWSFQDQLSFPYVAWNNDLKINPIDVDLWSNDVVWFDGHGRQ